MRYPDSHKEQTRARILEAATARFKVDGLTGAGVQSVMRDAGLTHGGFYAHFENKDALIAEAVRASLEATRAAWEARLGESTGRERLTQFLERYISLAHVEHVQQGCPAPPWISELGRAPDDARAAFADALDRWVNDLAAHLPESPGARAHAFSLISMAVGAVALARAASGPLATELIDAVRLFAIGTLDAAEPSK